MKTDHPYNDVPELETVQGMLLASAERFGEKIALEDLEPRPMGRLTYNDLLEAVLKFGAALRAEGMKPRAKIALLSENRLQWVVGYLTGMAFDYVVVPIDRNLTSNEIVNILHESEAEAALFSDLYADTIDEHRRSLKALRLCVNMDRSDEERKCRSMLGMMAAVEPASVESLPKIDPNALAALLFTSGTLGRSKGVMLSQRNLAANLVDMVRMVLIKPEDRFLSVLPIHHTYECTCGVLCPLSVGGSTHFARSMKTIPEDMRTVKPTILLGVPLLFDKFYKRIIQGMKEKATTAALGSALMKAGDVARRVGFGGFSRKAFGSLHAKFGGAIRMFIAGGAAPDPLVIQGMRKLGFTMFQGYGLTETSPILAVNRLEAMKDEAAGLPLPRVELRIDQPDENGVGEIWAKGPNVMLGYYQNEEATAEAFEDGRFKTGDFGRIDEDGFLIISGRKKNVIVSKSGKNVFPEELEDLLNRSPYVLESLVFGDVDPKRGEIVAAQIVPDADAFLELADKKKRKVSEEFIREVLAKEVESVNKQVASFKRIIRFETREREFEKTTTQKIKRFKEKPSGR